MDSYSQSFEPISPNSFAVDESQMEMDYAYGVQDFVQGMNDDDGNCCDDLALDGSSATAISDLEPDSEAAADACSIRATESDAHDQTESAATSDSTGLTSDIALAVQNQLQDESSITLLTDVIESDMHLMDDQEPGQVRLATLTDSSQLLQSSVPQGRDGPIVIHKDSSKLRCFLLATSVTTNADAAAVSFTVSTKAKWKLHVLQGDVFETAATVDNNHHPAIGSQIYVPSIAAFREFIKALEADILNALNPRVPQSEPESETEDEQRRTSILAFTLITYAEEIQRALEAQLNNSGLKGDTTSDPAADSHSPDQNGIAQLRTLVSTMLTTVVERIELLKLPKREQLFQMLMKEAREANGSEPNWAALKTFCQCCNEDEDEGEGDADLAGWCKDRVATYLSEFWAMIHEGKTHVIRRAKDYKQSFVFGSWKDHELFYANRSYQWIPKPRSQEGRKKKKNPPTSAAARRPSNWLFTHIWKDSENRREYTRQVFNPKAAPFRQTFVSTDDFNWWRGYKLDAEAAAQECMQKGLLDSNMKVKDGVLNPFLNHLLDMWCKGDTTQYEYVLNWFAHCCQFPWIKTEVIIVLVGLEGAGKTCVIDRIGNEIIGQHSYLLVDDIECITGKFNGCLKGRTLILLDECSYAGHHAQTKRLKNLVTGKTLNVNEKNVNQFVMENYTSAILSTNDQFAIPADRTARRFFALKVDDKWSGPQTAESKAYFDAFYAVPTCAIAHFLYTRDLTLANIKAVPKTALLRDQQKRTLHQDHPVQDWWHHVLSIQCMHATVQFSYSFKGREETQTVMISESNTGGARSRPSDSADSEQPAAAGGRPRAKDDLNEWHKCCQEPSREEMYSIFQNYILEKRRGPGFHSSTVMASVTQELFWKTIREVAGAKCSSNFTKDKCTRRRSGYGNARKYYFQMPKLNELRDAFRRYMRDPNWSFGDEEDSQPPNKKARMSDSEFN
jgi:hypothetical protein